MTVTTDLTTLDPSILARIIHLQKAVAQSGLNLSEAMETIVNGVQSLLNFDGTVIELVDNDSLVYRATSGPLAQGTIGMRVKQTSSLSGLAVKTRQVQRCNDTEKDPRVDHNACQRIGLRSMIVVPFCTASQIAGVLKVMSSQTNSFNHHHEIILSTITDSLAASLHNAEEAHQRAEKSLEQSSLNQALHEQKEFLNALLENLSEGVAACDAQGKLTIFNKKLREWHGLPPQQISPEQWAQHYDIFYSNGLTHMEKEDIPLYRALNGEQVTNSEMVIAPKNKSPRYILASAEAIYDNNKQRIGAVVILHDITAQKKAHNEISRLNQELELKVEARTHELSKAMQNLKANSIDLQIKSEALENSLNGFDIVNARGEFIYANKAYLKMWGYGSLKEIIGTSPATHCADPETALKIINLLKQNGECNIEFLAKRKDGSTFDVHMWARLAYDSEGNEIYPSTSVDITESKNYEKKLKEAIVSRDEFLSIASHELKTPLTSLKLQTQMRVRNLQRNELEKFTPENLYKHTTSDLMQLNRLSRLVDDMLDITRINTGKLTIQKEKTDLGLLVEDVVSRVNKDFQDNEIEITVSCPSPVIGNWDRFRLEQVVTNLVSNAVKYGKSKPIEVFISCLENQAELIVKDQGPGVKPEDQQRIFERFERAISKSEISGLGLGLHIVKEIVDRHGGSVQIKSQMGQGSSFIVRLPLEA
jgi:PAS domain S-box-containing protein